METQNTFSANSKSLEQIRKTLRKEQRDLKIRKLLKNKFAVTGFCITVFMSIIAIFAPFIANYDPLSMEVHDRLLGPSLKHFFGTDTFGRDLFSRVVYGARVSMGVGICVGILTMICGLAIGLYSSYYKSMDNILMRICDSLKAIPSILLAITLMSVIGPSTKNVILCLTIVSIPNMARIARSNALSIKNQTYIEAMRALGAKPFRIIWGHIAPNVLSPVIVQASFVFATSIVTEAALSFLGAGVPAPAPSWGNILYEGKTVIFKAWWLVAFPGIVTALSVLGLNLFGDGLRDFLDPLSN